MSREYPRYRVDDIAAVLPEEIEPKTTEKPISASINSEQRVRRARAYARSIPPAIEGQKGDYDTFRAACKVLRGFNLSDNECFAVLAEEFNPRCIPPWSDSDLRQKIRNAYRYGQQSAGGLLNEASEHNGKPRRDSPVAIEVVPVSDVVKEHVSWLWYPRIPLGKLTMLEGDPGVGKSFLTAALATAVSRGGGLPESQPSEPGNALMLSAEDGLADTIRPRLEQAGADLSRVFAVDRAFALDRDGCIELHRVISEHKPLLVTIDPVFAFVDGRTNIDRANEARAITARLAKIAEHHRCAFLLVRHLTKGGRDKSIYRGGGSIDWTAASRSVLLAGVDPSNKQHRALVQIKSNLGPIASPVGYSIEMGTFGWTGISDLTEHAILANEEQAIEAAGALKEAIEFLTELLSSGDVLQELVMKEAQQAGISDRTLQRAKRQLGMKSRKRVGDRKWEWYRP